MNWSCTCPLFFFLCSWEGGREEQLCLVALQSPKVITVEELSHYPECTGHVELLVDNSTEPEQCHFTVLALLCGSSLSYWDHFVFLGNLLGKLFFRFLLWLKALGCELITKKAW